MLLRMFCDLLLYCPNIAYILGGSKHCHKIPITSWFWARVLYKWGKSESEWVRVTLSGSAQSCSEWVRVTLSDSEWFRVAWSGWEQVGVGQSDSEWLGVGGCVKWKCPLLFVIDIFSTITIRQKSIYYLSNASFKVSQDFATICSSTSWRLRKILFNWCSISL